MRPSCSETFKSNFHLELACFPLLRKWLGNWRGVCAGAGLQVCPGRCCWSSERAQGPCPAQLPELAAWHEVSKQHTHWMMGESVNE